jgi:hypothetical protein
MVLKKSVYKLRSSIASFIFAQRDLKIIANYFSREQLLQLYPNTVARTDKEYFQMFEQIQIISCSSHFEILSSSLKEHLEVLNLNQINSDKRITPLRQLCKELRDAFSHIGKNELIPIWDEINPETLPIRVPVKSIEKGIIFDSYSRFSCIITIETTKNKVIVFNNNFIDKTLILSYHVLEILKKQKIKTLDYYLNKIPTLELLPEEKMPF